MTDFRNAETASPDMADVGMAPVDSKQLVHYVGFVLRAIWRRKLLAGTVFGLVMVATYGILRKMPRSYHVETKIFAQRQQAVPSIGLRSSYYADEAAPTQTASDLVHRRENLTSLIQQTRLLEKLRFTEDKSLSEEDKLNAAVGLLNEKLSVVAGEGTVTLSIDWPDGQMAYDLIQTALRNFLEARRISELSTVDEAIVLLKARAQGQRSELEAMQAQYYLQAKGLRAKGLVPRLGPFDPIAAQLRARIDARQRLIGESEEARRRKMEELQDQLATNLANYGERYPGVVSLKNEIEAMSKEPARLKTLRAEAQDLEAAYARRVTGPESETEETGLPGVTKPKRRIRASDSVEEMMDEAEARIRYARLNYVMLLERIENATIDLDTAGAAFKHRYGVIWPAQVAKYPDKPNVNQGLTFGLMVALFLAVAAATTADILGGRFLERWQVERALDLPVLAEVKRDEPA